MRDALFHPKVWLFHNSDATMAVHGSSNLTAAGIRKNVEQVTVSQSWCDPNQDYIVRKLTEQFRRLWSHDDTSCIVVRIPEAVTEQLLHTYRPDAPPTEEGLRALYRQASTVRSDRTATDDLPSLHRPHFTLPAGLDFRHGGFEHQGRAVDAWCQIPYRGVLEMATGSGKTVAAMLCAKRVYDDRRPLLVVVAAPYIPLIQQWCAEIAPLASHPSTLQKPWPPRPCESHWPSEKKAGGRTERCRDCGRVSRTLCDRALQSELRKAHCRMLLIADEVHNLGAAGFLAEPPSFLTID